ncbi:MAG: histidine phosphatase family protein [Caryophanon sp.]|nr:histidine phosphatase family protein [Caryophanon sp.]
MVRRVVVQLMRHEKTAGNVARKYVGQTDDPIVPIDREPVTEAAFTVYGSTLQRCRQTAKLYFPNAVYVADARLCELHFGDFEMKTYDELQDDACYRAWIDDPMNVTPPNGEAFSQFTARVRHAIDDIVSQNGQYVFVVHGGVIRYMQELCGVATFQQATATHDTLYTFTWDTIEQLKEGAPCTSFSEGRITAKQLMLNS